MGSYAELRKAEWLPAQMILKEMDYAALAREINARFGVPGRPQIVSRQFVSRLGNGKVKGNRCTPFLADCISQVLNVELDMLFVVRGVSDDAVGSSSPHQKVVA